jgi:hypothetical protein
MKLFRRNNSDRPSDVQFSEATGEVCTSLGRAEARLEKTKVRALRMGVGRLGL